LASRDRFFNLDFWWWILGGGAWDGVGNDDGSWLKSFRRGAKSGPPSGAGFLQKEKFRAALGADETSGDDLGVVKHKEVSGGKEGGKVANGMVGNLAGGSTDEEESGGVAGMGGGGGDAIRRNR